MTRLAALAAATLSADHEQGLAVMETAVRAAMTALGARLLEQLLAGEAGHRGPRIACGAEHEAGFVAYRAKRLDTVLGPIALRRRHRPVAVTRPAGDDRPRGRSRAVRPGRRTARRPGWDRPDR